MWLLLLNLKQLHRPRKPLNRRRCPTQRRRPRITSLRLKSRKPSNRSRWLTQKSDKTAKSTGKDRKSTWYQTVTSRKISDLLDNLPLDECVELSLRFLTSVHTVPNGAACSRAVMKTVYHFVAEYDSVARQLPGDIPQWHKVAAERMKERH